MPKLLLFAACEKVILSSDEGTASLITVLESVNVSIPPDTPIPPATMVPMKWSVFTLWRGEPGDDNRTYKQWIQLFLPGANLDLGATFEKMQDLDFSKMNQRIVLNITGFPVTQAGDCIVRLSLREGEAENPWRKCADWPINIIRGAVAHP